MLTAALGVYTDTETNRLPYKRTGELKSAAPLAEEAAFSEGLSVHPGRLVKLLESILPALPARFKTKNFFADAVNEVLAQLTFGT